MWWVGIASSLMYVVVTFQSKLYAYLCLYIYYVAVSVYGLWQWKFSRTVEQKSLPVSHATWRHAMVLTPLVVGLSVGLSYVLSTFTDSPRPTLEAVGTALSIVATWMLARKLLEHWLIWIVADTMMAVVFFSAERYPSMLLGLFYAAAAVYGYFAWRRNLET
jgi:nicotinamide mononucleotide transporter